MEKEDKNSNVGHKKNVVQDKIKAKNTCRYFFHVVDLNTIHIFWLCHHFWDNVLSFATGYMIDSYAIALSSYAGLSPVLSYSPKTFLQQHREYMENAISRLSFS